MLGLSPEEFHQITELVRPVPRASRRGFLDAMLAELQTAGGPLVSRQVSRPESDARAAWLSAFALSTGFPQAFARADYPL
jgi:hypothetical protein